MVLPQAQFQAHPNHPLQQPEFPSLSLRKPLLRFRQFEAPLKRQVMTGKMDVAKRCGQYHSVEPNAYLGPT